jgi:DNA invertase Pin-like site-specific DNA recombinase
MGEVYGYCVLTGPDQRSTIERFLAERGCVPARVFADDDNVRNNAWFARPKARELMSILKAGDQVAVAGLRPICADRRDVPTVLHELRKRGVVLHIVALSAKSPSLTVSGDLWNSFLRTLDVLFAFNACVHGEAIKEGLYVKKLKGERYTNYCGYGWRWQGPRGAQRRVADQSERATIRQIIELRDAGASWSQIALQLLRSGVRTAGGGEWSVSRARRAYLAATRGRRPDT